MVTREEKHSTRGRAHLLFEMMNGEVLTDGWRSEAVKDALDLCLACKGCKGDCPVNVDMATYKAEFLSHYYEGRLRPRHAYCDGLDLLVGPAGVAAPPTWPTSSARRRACATSPSGSAASTRAADARLRRGDVQGVVPAPAGRATRASRRSSSGPTPSTTTSTPRSPRRPSRCWRRPASRCWCRAASLCCGRPLYDFGMLDTAKSLLRQILEDPAAADRGRHPRRRPGAELRGRLPRRDDRTCSPTTRTPSGCTSSPSC